MKKIRFLLVLVCFLKSLSLFSQFDTEFWFAIPHVTPAYDKNNQYRLVFATADKESKVTISLPANPAFTPVSFTIPAKSSRIHNFSTQTPSQNSYVFPGNVADVKLNTGIKIIATEPVSCYYENYTPPQFDPLNNEIYSLKGRYALGMEFYLAFQNYLQNYSSLYTGAYSRFYIVATEDNTTVTIGPHEFRPNPTTVILKAGEVYTDRSANEDKIGYRPLGTKITSNKKVAITISEELLYNGTGTDVVGDQIIPVDYLGTKFIAVQGYLNALTGTSQYDAIYILGAEDGVTEVDIYDGGSLPTRTLLGPGYFAGRYNFKTQNTGALYIESNKKIYVYQISGYGNEVSYSLLPSLECKAPQSVSLVRSHGKQVGYTDLDDFYLLLVCKTANINGFTFNGNSGIITSADFNPVFQMPEYSYARKLISQGQLSRDSVARVENTLGEFQLGFVSKAIRNAGPIGSAQFGYFSEFAKYQFEIDAVNSVDSVCMGGTLYLKSNPISFPNATYQWNGPNGYAGTPNNPEVIIPNAQEKNSGLYKLTGYMEETILGSKSKCTVQPDAIYTLVTSPEPEFTVADNCEGTPVAIVNKTPNKENKKFVWNFGDDTPNQNGVNPTHIYEESGTYTITLWAEFQECKDSISHSINVGKVVIGKDTATICAGEKYNLNGHILTDTGDYLDTVKNASGNCDSIIYFRLNVRTLITARDTATICSGKNYNLNGHILTAEGNYVDTVKSASGCDSIIYFRLNVFTITAKDTASICAGKGYFFNKRILTAEGDYVDTVKNSNGCDSIIYLRLNVFTITAKDTLSICAGKNYNLNGHILTAAGDYVDTVKNSNGCDSIIYLHLKVLDTLQTLIKDTVCYGSIYEKNAFNLPAQLKSGTHRLTLQSHYKCDSTIILDLTVLPEMKVNLPPHKTICETDFKPYTISANIGNYDYKWSTGAITSGITINETSHGDYTYTVTVTNSLNCQTTGEHTLTIKQSPTKTEIISHTDNFCENNVAILEVLTDGTSVKWSTGATTFITEVYASGPYTVISSIENCEMSSEEYTIKECPCPVTIPNIFTPNNDKINDTFSPDIPCELKSFSMYIYNRWGKLVYASDSYLPWDGKCNGRDVAAGTYYYVIQYFTVNNPSKEEKIQGTVTLVR